MVKKPSQPPWSLFTIPDYHNFFGRETEVKQLEQHIDQYPITLIWGKPPGIGKTYLAAQLAKILSNDYKVCWIDKYDLSVEDLLFYVNDFLKYIGEQGFFTTYSDQHVELKSKITTLLQIINKNSYIFIIDNFQNSNRSEFQFFLERFYTHAGVCRLILIDQEPLYVELGSSLGEKIRRFQVCGFHKQEAINYILERSQDSRIGWSEKDLVEVIIKTDGHPLAMNLIIQWRIVGATLENVLDRLIEYDERSGSALHQKLLADIKERLEKIHQDALHRLAVFRTPIQFSAWAYLEIPENVGEMLLQCRLLEPVGIDQFQMHPLMREFWYTGLDSKAKWHAKAAYYHWDIGKKSPLKILDIPSYLEAYYHLAKDGQKEQEKQVVNELIRRIHEQERLPSEKLPSLKSWFIQLDDTVIIDKPWLLFEKGRKLEKDGRGAEAQVIFHRAYATFEKQGDKLGSSVALYYIGKMHHLQKNINIALSALRSAYDVAIIRDDRAMQLRVLGKILDCYVDMGRYNDATSTAWDAEKLACTENDELGHALILYRRGKIERRQSNFAQAARFFIQAKDIFERLGDVYRVSKSLSRLGVVQGYLGQYKEARQSFDEAINIKRSIEDNYGISRDIDYLGDILTFCGEYKEAELYYNDSLSIKNGYGETNKDIYGQIKSYNNLGKVAIFVGDLSRAKSYLEKSCELIGRSNKRYIGVNGALLSNLGDVYSAQGEYKEALKYYKDASSYFISPRPNIPHSYVRSMFNIGRVYLEMRYVNLAKQYLEIALEISKKHHIRYYECLSLTHIARLKSLLGKEDEAKSINEFATNISGNIASKYTTVICLETKAMLEEMRILNCIEFEYTKNKLSNKEIEEYIQSPWRYYNDAIEKSLDMGLKIDTERLKLKKYLWPFTVKILYQDTVSLDGLYRLLMTESSSSMSHAICLELLNAKSTAHILHSIPSRLASRLASRSLQLLSPIAMQFNYNELREPIDNLSFAFLYPVEYQEIMYKLKHFFPNHYKFIKNIKEIIESRLHEANIKAHIIPRAKEIYSIYRKQKARQVSLDMIFDLIGFRIITGTEWECYRVLEIIKTMGTLFEGKGVLREPIRDYIRRPKALTGYQSIHVNIMVGEPTPRVVEFQIRTHEMHLNAEMGLGFLGLDRAAHWRYKDSKSYNKPLSSRSQESRQHSVRIRVECNQNALEKLIKHIRSFKSIEVFNIKTHLLENDNDKIFSYDRKIVVDMEILSKEGGKKSLKENTSRFQNTLINSLMKHIPGCVVYIASS